MNYFLVESPLQYLNAREAYHNYCSSNEENILIVFRGASEKNLKQIKNLISVDKWNTIYTVADSHQKSKLYKCQKELEEILKRSGTKGVHRVFIGEYRSLLMRNFVHQSNCENPYLLDDGNVSLSIHKKIVSGEGLRKALHPLRKILNWLYGLNDYDVWDIRFFTVYQESVRDRDTVNDYSFLKGKLKRKKVDQKVVWFLGNNISELNIVERKYYLSLLAEVINFFKNYEVYYIPHRREDSRGFSQIEDLGFKLRLTNEPIETYLIKHNYLPATLASFRSSALDNCYYLFGKVLTIYAFSFDTATVNSTQYQKSSEIIFNTYRSYNSSIFKVVEI